MSSETERITRAVLDRFGYNQMAARLEQVCGEQGEFGYHAANDTLFASASLIEAAKAAHEHPLDLPSNSHHLPEFQIRAGLSG